MTNYVTSIESYTSADAFINVHNDLVATSAYHPSETLICAGPARLEAARDNLMATLLPIGLVMSFSDQAQLANQPVDHLGTNRLANAGGRPRYSWSMSRTCVAGRDLSRCLYTFYVQRLATGGFDINDDRIIRPDADVPGINKGLGAQWTNFESELFNAPFGLYRLQRTRDKRTRMIAYLGAYLNGNGTGEQGGQAQSAESISGWCDQRIEIPLGAAVLGDLREQFARMITGDAVVPDDFGVR